MHGAYLNHFDEVMVRTTLNLADDALLAARQVAKQERRACARCSTSRFGVALSALANALVEQPDTEIPMSADRTA